MDYETKEQLRHSDGTLCLEGTRRVPRAYRACCEAFDARTFTCVHDVRYEWWPGQKTWVIRISEQSGGGGIAMAYCPHCGAKLKGSGKSGRWLEI
jgi:hypothetical protein